MRRILTIVVVLFLVSATSKSQGTIDGNPIKQKWKQINTDTLRVIFPAEIEDQAQNVSNIIHYIAAQDNASVGNRLRKLNVLMKNNTTIPNGFVGMAPFKSEFFCTPPQDPYTVGGDDFINTLAVHEYRHAQQMTNQLRGFAWIPYIFSGEGGFGTFTNLIAPNWYYEGDAVISETALTNGGRGRLPAFFNEFRSNMLDGNKLSYMKLRNGSYKERLPHHYRLGYLICEKGREVGGNNVWNSINGSAMRLHRIIFPFSNSTKKHTGYNTRQLFNLARDDYKKKYEDKLSKINIVDGELITKKRKTVTNYFNPVVVGDNTYAVRSSFDDIAAIVKVSSDGKDDVIVRPGTTMDNYFSTNGEIFTWSESAFHFRWNSFDYSNIVVYNSVTKEKKYITSKGKYFSPAISSDGSKIAAVRFTPEGACNIVIMNPKTGEELKVLSNPDKDFVQYPVWNEDDLIYTTRKAGVFKLMTHSVAEDKSKVVYGPINQVLCNAVPMGEDICFAASFSGIDNVYKINTNTKKITKLTDVAVGAYAPYLSSDKSSLVFSNFTAKGNELRKLKLNDAVNKVIKVKPLHEMKEFDNIAIKSEGGNIFDKINYRKYEVKDYSKIRHAANIHSWGFNYTDQEASAKISSQNILNSLDMNISLTRNFNENSNIFDISADYAGFWVKTGAFLRTSGSRSIKVLGYENNKFLWKDLDWNEHIGGVKFEMPYNFSKGIYYRGISLASTMTYQKIDFDKNKYGYSDKNFANASLGFSIYNLRKAAMQNMGYRAGQMFSVGYNRSVGERYAEEITADLSLYFPGICKNHNIEVKPSYKWNGDNSKYRYLDTFVYTRGYKVPKSYHDVVRTTVNYNFPVAYPQFGLNGFFYVNRLTSTIFYDWSMINTNKAENQKQYSSVGAELLLDVKLGHLIPMKVGARSSYLLNGKRESGESSNVFTEVVVRMAF